MGRGGNEFAPENLLYGRKVIQDASLDAAEPSPLARRRAAELLEAYKNRDFETFCRGLRGTKNQRFGNTPLIDEILRETSTYEVEAMLKRHGIKRRAKGAAEERSDLTRSLARVINERAQAWEQPEEIQDSVLQSGDFELLALRHPGNGPVKDFFTNRIASRSNLGGIKSNEILTLLMSDDASKEAEVAFEQNLKRTAVEAFVRAEGSMNRYSKHNHRYSKDVGYLRHSGRSLLLHLRNDYQTLCGKDNVRSAPYGAWKDAEVSDRYRQCKECLKRAGSGPIERADSERLDILPIDVPEGYLDNVIKSKKVQRVLKKATRSQEDFDRLIEVPDNWRADSGAELRAAMVEEMSGLFVEERNRMIEKKRNNSDVFSEFWDRIETKYREPMLERGYEIGHRWRSTSPEGNDWQEVFDREFRERVVEKEVEKFTNRVNGDFDESRRIDDQLSRLINRRVKKFITSTRPEAKPDE